MIKRIGWLNRHTVGSYLQEHEMMLGPLLGNICAHGWMYQSAALRSGRVVAAVEGGEVRALAARFNDGNCMIHGQKPEDTLLLAGELAEMRFHTLWMLGCGSAVAREMNGLLALRAAVIGQHMMLQPEPVSTVPGRLVIEDISTDPYDSEYIEGACRLLEACFHYRPAREVFAQRMAERTVEEIYLLGRLDGVHVGQAHIQAWTEHYGHIGGVATLPGYTGQGIARALTGELCRYIHEEGRLPTLTVRRDNTPALRLYDRLGFAPVGEVTVLDAYGSR